MTIYYDIIPNELKALNQWVSWKIEDVKGNGGTIKKTKVPYSAGTQSKASTTNPKDWSGFLSTVEAVKCGLHEGIGFVFCKDDPYCFIDLDHCIDENGCIEPNSKRIVDLLDSYTEISQSGYGIHVIVKAKLQQGTGNRKGSFEIYDSGRYCAMTGNVIPGYRPTIEERQEQVNQICDEIFGNPKHKKPAGKEASTIALSDQEIIEKASSAKNADKFNRLMSGDWSGYPSQSEGDLALAGMLAFWTQDIDQIESIMRTSGLARDKWDKHKTYLVDTIQKASSGRERYNSSGNNTDIESNKADGHISEDTETDSKNNNPNKYFQEGTFIPALLAEELICDYDFICVNGLLYVYQKGVYMAIGDDYVETESYSRLGHKARANRVTEVVKYIKAMTRIEYSRLNTSRDLINLENGMLNYKTGKLLEHSKGYLSTIRIPVKYDPNVSNSTISEWLESTLVDPECIQLACELFGYCLIPDTTMAKAFMLVGSGANGKSTFLTVLENFIGKDNVSKVPLQELSDHRFKRAELFGKLVNLFADLDNRALESTSYFKTIVTGDSIDAERKNQNPFSFRPFARLVFSANEIPRSRDKSFAYYRRWCIIPFERQFMGADDKKGLAEELSRPENLSALLNCALPRLRKVFEYGAFSEPAKVRNALGEYEKQNDPVKAFVDECCKLDPVSRIERGSLYDAFCRYCNEAGFRSVTRNNFYQRLRIFREIREIKTPDARMFEGIKLTVN